jgi:hypothetical protein
MNITPGETVYAGKQCERCKWEDSNFYRNDPDYADYWCTHRDNKVDREFSTEDGRDSWVEQVPLLTVFANPNNDCPHFEGMKE